MYHVLNWVIWTGFGPWLTASNKIVFAENVPAVYSLLQHDKRDRFNTKILLSAFTIHLDRERGGSREKNREAVHQHPSALFLAWCWISAKQQVGYHLFYLDSNWKKHPFRLIQFHQIWRIKKCSEVRYLTLSAGMVHEIFREDKQ